MKNAIRSAGLLRECLGLPLEQTGELVPGEVSSTTETCSNTNASIAAADYGFPIFVTREFVSRMRPGDPNDPLLRQVLPVSDEAAVVDGFGSDPVGDLHANVAPGVLHKYHGRALVVTTGACGIHCRYCFRREFPYAAAGSRGQAFEPSLQYLREHDDIEEVILSGGDPLTMTDAAIDSLVERIEGIDHVTRLRIHTRMPIVVPSRVTLGLIERLRSSRLNVWVVVHVNHASEIDTPTQAALERFVDAGIPTLNQSVLLAGVNDDAATLERLSRRLMECRVMPYYLHQLDRVTGAAHFEVSPERGRELIAELETRLPGFAVPRYVAELAGRASKTRI
ncbi:EF-P beta-lysylation protein EpmB [Neorhodopirellula pilleata]|nr:EF-P beta-lysylation protein EpmB [Neorhodopirellula pilleata]